MKTITQKRRSENLESKVGHPAKNMMSTNSILWNLKRRYR